MVGSLGSRQNALASVDVDQASVESFPILAAYVAISVAALNLVTGDVPLFADDVNSARFAGNFGVAGWAWPILFPILQAIVLHAGVRKLGGYRVPSSLLTAGILSVLLLVLSGGRSLLGIPILGIFLFYLDSRHPRIPVVVLVGVASSLLFAILGALRIAGGNQAEASANFLSERGLDPVLGSLDISLQAGPRVFERLIQGHARLQYSGQFLTSDVLNFLRLAPTPSDRLVTVALGQDPSIVGGLPPTLVGGLFLDFGALGVGLGCFLVGIVLARGVVVAQTRLHDSSTLWAYYFAAYVLISSYSYLSVRPSWLCVGLICAAMGLKERSGSKGSVHI